MAGEQQQAVADLLAAVATQDQNIRILVQENTRLRAELDRAVKLLDQVHGRMQDGRTNQTIGGPY